MRQLKLQWEGQSLEIGLTLRSPHAVLAREGPPFEAEFRRDGNWIEIRSGGRSARCGVAHTSRGVWVEHEGRTYFLERSHREAAARGGVHAADEIRAPMTGRVISVAARAGAEAREGELLLTIEAMKMEFKLTAPEDGKVAEVFCAEGDRVELGQLLVRLEPTGTA